MAEVVRDTETTSCVIVGGGPGGMVLALLLIRKGIRVTLLESHKDFDRDFRGDTVHPSTLEMLDEMGLAGRLHQVPHGRIGVIQLNTPSGSVQMADLRRVKTKFPYIMMLPQSKFLDFLADEMRAYPNFRLIMGANVQRLIEENGRVVGVRYRGADGGWHDVRATLTVGADGRFSKVRQLVGFEPVKTSAPMDVLWFRLPRKPSDPVEGIGGFITPGALVVLFNRDDQWQAAYVFPKGEYAKLKAEGFDAFKRHVVERVPFLADRIDTLHDWHECAVLSVESSRLRKWYKPGLLLIGDAAHVKSPVGGVGINYAIQDAVEAANVLTEPLRQGRLTVRHLQTIQRRRMLPTRIIQMIQGLIQNNVVAPALKGGKEIQLPLLMRLMPRIPGLRNLPARMFAFGIFPPRIQH